MTRALSLGYVPLLDAAPLILAEALGFAEEEGLRLDLQAAPSWAALRDMLALGHVTAAQMLSPLPVAQALGLSRSPARFEALSVLNLNGNVIGVSQALATRMRDAGHAFDFADAAAAGRALLATGDPLRIGVPFAFSMHHELVQYWLAAVGAAPAGIEIRTIPPARMAAALAAGEISVFCVGEPWGSVAVEAQAGTLLLPGAAIWAAAPEKVLATQVGWAAADPDLAGRLMRAVWRAGRWLDSPANHLMAAEVLTAPGRLAVPPDLIERALTGRMVIGPGGPDRTGPPLITFFAGATTFPWRSQAAWIGTRLARRHGLDPARAAATAATVFRSDLYRQHLREAGADLPAASQKREGALAAPTQVASERGTLTLPTDRFFDALIFDPDGPGALKKRAE
jgi:NitT/TauT family transport system ATP-binding protein